MTTYTWEDVGDDSKRVLTQSEKETIAAEWNVYEDGRLDRNLARLRIKRNLRLSETDYLGVSDQTMSDAWTTYRQELRDLPVGLDTVEKVAVVVFPTKPE